MSVLSASCLHQMIGCSLSSYVVFWRRLGRDLIGFARWFDMSLSAFSKRWREQIQKRGELFAALPDTKIMFFEGDSKSYMKYIDINEVVKASCMPCFSFFLYAARKSQMVGISVLLLLYNGGKTRLKSVGFWFYAYFLLEFVGRYEKTMYICKRIW